MMYVLAILLIFCLTFAFGFSLFCLFDYGLIAIFIAAITGYSLYKILRFLYEDYMSVVPKNSSTDNRSIPACSQDLLEFCMRGSIPGDSLDDWED